MNTPRVTEPTRVRTRSLSGDKSYFAECFACPSHIQPWEGPNHWSGKNAVRDEKRARALAAADRRTHIAARVTDVG